LKGAILRKKPRLTLLDAVIMLVVTAILGYIGYRITVGLHYKWNWSAIPRYLFRIDENGNWKANLLMQGLFTTIRLSIWATLLATIIGTIAGFFRISKSLFKRLLGRTFVELIRNTPPPVLIFIFYFFVSGQIMPILGVDDFARNASESTQSMTTFLFAPPRFLSAFISATVTLAFSGEPIITEITRAEIQSSKKVNSIQCLALDLP